MVQFILNKFFYGILTLFGVVTVIFLLFNVLPGDPARMMLDQREDSEQLQNIRKKYGFDQLIYKLLKNKIKINIKTHKKYWLDIGRPDDYSEAIKQIESNKNVFLDE